MSMLQIELQDLLDERIASLCAAADSPFRGGDQALLRRVLLVSDYAHDQLRRRPLPLSELYDDAAPPALEALSENQWQPALRQYRHRQNLGLILRDVAGRDDIEATLAGSSALAERCCTLALDALAQRQAGIHGWPRDADGQPQSLIVFGLGKLGGGELNFSSDIDLVFAYVENGITDGARPLDNETAFQRLGQQLIRLLDEVTPDGFVHRVDMRLRPFGKSGRLALSAAAMEQYFQREGRDWERYAWIKARPVAGDIAAGETLLRELRPFIYRRYFDYTAFDGLREMKSMIEAEVQRRDLAEHLKLGPGGIREIEFVVQLQQMIRGGREPALRSRGLLDSLAALVGLGHMKPAVGRRLKDAYRFLRHAENRLQMLRDAQVHCLPEVPLDRLRIAVGLGFDSVDAFESRLAEHRAVVREAFEQTFESRRVSSSAAGYTDYWRQIDREADAGGLADAGFPDAGRAHARLQEFAGSPVRGLLSARASARLDRLLPALLAAAAASPAPLVVLDRLLRLLQAVLRRSSYLALLDEQPAARARLVEIMGASAWMAERLCAHPLLLDDLLDHRASAAPDSPAAVADELQHALAEVDRGDAEALLHALNEFRHSVGFRIALASLLKRQSAVRTAAQLTWVAECIVEALLPLMHAELVEAHGQLPGTDDGGLAVLAYGSFGARELGFNSDLDLVFLYQANPSAESDGRRPLDAQRYFARGVQKLIGLLATPTAAGRLFEADLRLRPDGGKGMLVSTVDSFAAYQRERAWTWEQQALVRARFVAGDPAVAARFAPVRADTLARMRDPDSVRDDVARMRRRMRAELDRSRDGRFDLKQGAGGLVDLEFLLQAGVLIGAVRHPDLLQNPSTPALIEACARSGLFDAAAVAPLQAAHETLLARSLACTLDNRPRVVALDDDIEAARGTIIDVMHGAGLSTALDIERSAAAPGIGMDDH